MTWVGRRCREVPAAGRVRAAAVLALLVSGCGPGTQPDAGTGDAGPAPACSPDPDTDPEILVGSGDETWLDLVAGAAIALHAGPQGGYHLFASVRARGFDCASAQIHVRVYEVDGTTVLGEVITTVDLVPATGPGTAAVDAQYLGIAVILTPWNLVALPIAMAELTGRPLALELTLTDAATRTATASLAVVGDCCL